MKKIVLAGVMLGLSACATTTPATDSCGYTWFKNRPTALVFTLRQEPDWLKYPGQCQTPAIEGCVIDELVDGQRVAHLLVRRVPDEEVTRGVCNAVLHEVRHGLGFDHEESYYYVPRDFTHP